MKLHKSSFHPEELEHVEDSGVRLPDDIAPIGMKVRLASGGPIMEVRAVTETGLLRCHWKISEHESASETFDKKTLRLA